MADEEKTDTKKTIETVNRFNENCFLFDHIGQLVKLNENISSQKPYKNFVMLNDDIGEIIQELVGKKGLDPLFNITPAQIALLVPKIQIFKVMYKNSGAKEPFEREFIFNDFTSPRSIENITNNKMTRGDDVGIKSFEFKFEGVTPVLGGTVNAKLNLFFQNIQSLLNDPPKDGISFRDFILRGANTYPVNTSNKTNSCDGISDKDRQYDSRSFQIKIVVGWADPSDPKNVLINRQLLESIRNSKTVLFLNLIKHDINFRENGAVEVSLEYNGGMEGVMSNEKSNIFYLTDIGKLANTRREKEKQETKKKNETQSKEPSIKPIDASSAIKGVISSTGETSENSLTISTDPKKRNKADFDKLVTTLMESYDKQEKYSRLLNALQSSGKLFYVDVDEKQIEVFNKSISEGIETLKEQNLSGEELTDDKIREIMLLIRNAYKDKNSKLDIKRVINESDAAFGITRNTNLAVNMPKLPDISKMGTFDMLSAGWDLVVHKKITIPQNTGDDKQKIIENGATAVHGKYAKTLEGQKRINFFFFGDLLEIVLNVLMDQNRNDNYNMKVMLGPYIFNDPDSGQKVEYNLADIPISLNIFLAWYMDKVIKPQVSEYSLSNFIQDIAKELIVPVLEKDKCYFSDMTLNSPNIRLEFFSVPDVGNNLEPGKRYKLNDLRAGKKDVSSGSKHHDIKKLVHYLFIFISNEDMTKYRGDYEEDKKRGIYHLVLGSDRGLVRSIKFTKFNIAMGAEIMAESSTTDQKFRFDGLYNANVTMVGNNIFSLGTKFYLDASRILGFLGDKNSVGTLAHQLRLGGYYEIIRINNSISKDDNITELEAKWINSEVSNSCTPLQKINKRKENSEKLLNGFRSGYAVGLNKLVDQETGKK